MEVEREEEKEEKSVVVVGGGVVCSRVRREMRLRFGRGGRRVMTERGSGKAECENGNNCTKHITFYIIVSTTVTIDTNESAEARLYHSLPVRSSGQWVHGSSCLHHLCHSTQVPFWS